MSVGSVEINERYESGCVRIYTLASTDKSSCNSYFRTKSDKFLLTPHFLNYVIPPSFLLQSFESLFLFKSRILLWTRPKKIRHYSVKHFAIKNVVLIISFVKQLLVFFSAISIVLNTYYEMPASGSKFQQGFFFLTFSPRFNILSRKKTMSFVVRTKVIP